MKAINRLNIKFKRYLNKENGVIELHPCELSRGCDRAIEGHSPIFDIRENPVCIIDFEDLERAVKDIREEIDFFSSGNYACHTCECICSGGLQYHYNEEVYYFCSGECVDSHCNKFFQNERD